MATVAVRETSVPSVTEYVMLSVTPTGRSTAVRVEVDDAEGGGNAHQRYPSLTTHLRGVRERVCARERLVPHERERAIRLKRDDAVLRVVDEGRCEFCLVSGVVVHVVGQNTKGEGKRGHPSSDVHLRDDVVNRSGRPVHSERDRRRVAVRVAVIRMCVNESVPVNVWSHANQKLPLIMSTTTPCCALVAASCALSPGLSSRAW
eukprot:TRINITY_DN505_c0_g2_i1.p1 TRINITY_DN505_c0_g2~~TRINITY_DN505_c0_g2_i1.p1  ORF type:complete len:204 (+),score=14.05 TRINITY_DN505_c0_g2_i1:225-836(+)